MTEYLIGCDPRRTDEENLRDIMEVLGTTRTVAVYYLGFVRGEHDGGEPTCVFRAMPITIPG
jgi:hypothetical protein